MGLKNTTHLKMLFIIYCTILIITLHILPNSNLHTNNSLISNQPEISDTSEPFIPNSQVRNNPLNPSQISMNFTEMIFINGILTLNINTTKSVSYFVYYEIQNFIGPQSTILISDTTTKTEIAPGYQEIALKIHIPWYSLPGEYFLFAYLFIQNTTTSSFDFAIQEFFIFNIILGPIFADCLLFIFLAGLLYLIIQKERLNTIPHLHKTFIQRIGSKILYLRKKMNFSLMNPGIDLQFPLIECPDCKKSIIEGSAFCPWCGYHLKKFERFML